MARYLIVAYQTAGSPELAERIRSLVAEDAEAEFTLLVPATPPSHLHTWEEGEARQLALRRGSEAAERLRAAGAKVEAVRVGAHRPLDAVSDELYAHGGYQAIVVSTFPPGLSRWLGGDLPNQLRRRTRLPVHHVIAAPVRAGHEPSSA
jgi:nucleotide-binding universal stress UspA family protein